MLKMSFAGVVLILLLGACGGGNDAQQPSGMTELQANKEVDTVRNTIMAELYPRPRLSAEELRRKREAEAILNQATDRIRPELVQMFQTRDVAKFTQTQADVRLRIENEFIAGLQRSLKLEIGAAKRLLAQMRTR